MYRRHRHEVIFTDAITAMNVGRFLDRVLASEAEQLGVPAPRLVHVANSRSAIEQVAPWPTDEERQSMKTRHIRRAEQRYHKISRVHSTAIAKYVKEQGQGAARALVVTDTVNSGRSLRRLGDAVRDMGMTPDYAILATARQGQDLADAIGAQSDSEISAVHAEQDLHMRKPGIIEHIGYYTTLGVAEPQVNAPDHVDQYGLHLLAAGQLYDSMADDYIAAHLQSAPEMKPT